MKVFKFGGASVKDADSVRNVASVLAHFPNEEILVVVSAMGKTTNALENLVNSFFNQKGDCPQIIQEIRNDHLKIINELFPSDEHRIHNDIEILLMQLEVITQAVPEDNFNKTYDHIVSYGELLSTKIISSYLNSTGYQNKWLDARRLIRTDQNYRFARVQWNFTERLLKETIKEGNRYVVQGFIGSDDDLNPTTLGREGSDYTAAVLGYLLKAEEVIIWKDVPGVLNGDPKIFDDTELLNQISYKEAIELAYYGASVIHPKTIQPLQKGGIPLAVRSFMNPSATGTKIEEGAILEPFMPCFIKKENQLVISVSTRDLAFIIEDHLSKIYTVFHQFAARVNMTQNTAISSSFCVNNDPIIIPKLIEALKEEFDVELLENVNLYSVRHYDEIAKARVQAGGKVLMEQITTDTYQVVTQ